MSSDTQIASTNRVLYLLIIYHNDIYRIIFEAELIFNNQHSSITFLCVSLSFSFSFFFLFFYVSFLVFFYLFIYLLILSWYFEVLNEIKDNTSSNYVIKYTTTIYIYTQIYTTTIYIVHYFSLLYKVIKTIFN